MKSFSFRTTIHLDRLDDLELLIKGIQVDVEPVAFVGDRTVEFCISGEKATTHRLMQCIQSLPFLATAPVLEGSE